MVFFFPIYFESFTILFFSLQNHMLALSNYLIMFKKEFPKVKDNS
jgi:hypothetical protein